MEELMIVGEFQRAMASLDERPAEYVGRDSGLGVGGRRDGPRGHHDPSVLASPAPAVFPVQDLGLGFRVRLSVQAFLGSKLP